MSTQCVGSVFKNAHLSLAGWLVLLSRWKHTCDDCCVVCCIALPLPLCCTWPKMFQHCKKAGEIMCDLLFVRWGTMFGEKLANSTALAAVRCTAARCVLSDRGATWHSLGCRPHLWHRLQQWCHVGAMPNCFALCITLQLGN